MREVEKLLKLLAAGVLGDLRDLINGDKYPILFVMQMRDMDSGLRLASCRVLYIFADMYEKKR